MKPLTRVAAILFGVLIYEGSLATNVRAQKVESQESAAKVADEAQPAKTSPAKTLPKIVKVSPEKGSLGTTVCFTLDGGPPEGQKFDSLVLFIKGQIAKEIEPDSTDPEHKRVYFTMRRNDKNAALWQQVLRIAGNDHPEVRTGWQSTGPLDMAPDVQEFSLVVDGTRILVFLIVFISFAVSFFVLAARSNLLKNTDSSSGVPSTGPYAYSLGRVQMAWWFFITLASILIVWLVAGVFAANDQVLILIGISGATGAGAIAIDAGKQGDAAQKAADVGTKAAAVGSAAASAHVAPAGAPATIVNAFASTQATLSLLQNDLNEKAKTLESNAKPPKSKNSFLRDILSDRNGISFHRFQIFTWTVVVGIYFIFQVFDSWALPQLNGTILVLMGISGGTYLGFKFPELRN
jgi:hypothetical protein